MTIILNRPFGYASLRSPFVFAQDEEGERIRELALRLRSG